MKIYIMLDGTTKTELKTLDDELNCKGIIIDGGLTCKQILDYLQRDKTEIEKRHAEMIRTALENVNGLFLATWKVE